MLIFFGIFCLFLRCDKKSVYQSIENCMLVCLGIVTIWFYVTFCVLVFCICQPHASRIAHAGASVDLAIFSLHLAGECEAESGLLEFLIILKSKKR